MGKTMKYTFIKSNISLLLTQLCQASIYIIYTLYIMLYIKLNIYVYIYIYIYIYIVFVLS